MPLRSVAGRGPPQQGKLRGGQSGLVMRWGPVHGGGLAGGLFGVRDTLGKALDAALQPLDQLPLRRNGRVEVLNRLVLMDHTHFKLVEAGGVR